MDRLIALVALRWRLEARAVVGLAGAAGRAPRRRSRARSSSRLAAAFVAFSLGAARSSAPQPELLLPALSAVATLFGLTWALSPLLAGVSATETHDLGKLLPYPVPLPTLVASSLLANLLQPMVLAQAAAARGPRPRPGRGGRARRGGARRASPSASPSCSRPARRWASPCTRSPGTGGGTTARSSPASASASPSASCRSCC